MHILTAIETGFKKSLTFSGRATRAEFWLFLPVGLAAPILLVAASWLAGLHLFIAIPLVAISATPLFAVGARRLQDTGEHGSDAYRPWATACAALCLASWGGGALSTFNSAFSSQTTPDGPTGLGFALQYGLGGLILLIIAALCLLVFLFTLTPAIGQTLVPSQQGTNKYGPSPMQEKT